jgi:hypothetical protein
MTGLQQVQSQGRTNDRIESQALSVSLAIAKRQQLLENAWWEPRAGAGVRLSRAQALDIAAEPAVSFRPVAQLALASGVRLSSTWSLRVDVIGDLVLNRDNYAIKPYGTVGRGPRGLLFATFGAEFLAW